ncbi:hypothetical protein LXL04_022019 [Taraxacum kok-saghyz]
MEEEKWPFITAEKPRVLHPVKIPLFSNFFIFHLHLHRPSPPLHRDISVLLPLHLHLPSSSSSTTSTPSRQLCLPPHNSFTNRADLSIPSISFNSPQAFLLPLFFDSSKILSCRPAIGAPQLKFLGMLKCDCNPRSCPVFTLTFIFICVFNFRFLKTPANVSTTIFWFIYQTQYIDARNDRCFLC